MSDEVRSNSSPAPPESGGPRLDPVDGPKSLEIEFPTPDIDLVDSSPVDGPVAGIHDGATAGVAVLPHRDVATLRPAAQNDSTPRDPAARDPIPRDPVTRDAVPRPSERPPPPSQRQASQHRFDAVITPVPPSPHAVPNPVPMAPVTTTLPAPAPVLNLPPAPGLFPPPAPLPFSHEALGDTPPPPPFAVTGPVAPTGAVAETGASASADPFAATGAFDPADPFAPAASFAPTASSAPDGPAVTGGSGVITEPAPAPRMLSEPVPLVTKAAPSSPPSKQTLRPGLVEPKRIIQVLGSNVPVLDTALEEDAIEDLDDSEAPELAEAPSSDVPISVPDAELEVSVVVEEESPDESRAAAADDDALGVAAEPAPPSPDYGSASNGGFDAGPTDADGKRVKAPPNRRRRPPPPSSRSSEMRKVDPAQTGARKWWEEMFSEEFLRAIPILSPKQLEREVNFIDEALAADRFARILDLACGAGQHAVELATRGYDLVGFDLSQSQLDWAGGLAQERNQKLQFTYGDMRDLSYNESFDAVFCWNTSFGFFEEDKNVDVLQRVFRALRPGGRFLLDVINRDFVVAQQPGQTWFEGDGCVCIDDVSIDFITSRMKVKRTLMLTNGKNRECNYSVRIYGLHELGKMLHDVGFKVLNVSGRPEMPGVFFGATSPRIIILAVKP